DLKAALVDDVEVLTRTRECHATWKRALESPLRRGYDVERPIERVASAVQVDRTDDSPGDRVGNPDIAVLAARQIHAAAVWRERDAEKARVQIDPLHRGRRAAES